MKVRSLVIATLALSILGGILYWSGHRKPTEEAGKPSSDAPPAVLKLDQAGITKIDLERKGTDEIVLAKSGTGSWRILEPKPLGAEQSTVSSMLSTLSSLNAERLVEDKAVDLKQYGLDQPAVAVKVTASDHQTHQLRIGDDTPTGGTVYTMLAGDPRVFTIASFNKTNLDKSLNDLRDKRLLTVNPDKISRVELIRRDHEIEFGRNNQNWQILRPKPLRADSFLVGDLVRKLSDARMDFSGSDSEHKDPATVFAHAIPIATARVTDESGTQELQIRKSGNTCYAKSSVIDGVYEVGSDLSQGLDKELNDFRNKKLFDFSFPDPHKVELHSGSKAYFLTSSGDDWWSNGKKMDPGSVQALVAKLRDLSASKFVDSGFITPTIDVTVTSDDGKRVERVLISKSGHNYVAKRENEPALYQLDSSSVDDLQKAADDVKPAAIPGK
jgi:hypothetical protein